MNIYRPVTNASSTRYRQQGGVLIISLLVLLVLTLIGVSSLDGSIMEEKMASNSQISTTVFQSAESAISASAADYNRNDASRSLAYDDAVNQTESDCNSCDVNSGTRMVYVGETLLPNTSGHIAVSRGIEIIGTATHRGIEDSNAQGYIIHPMRKDPK